MLIANDFFTKAYQRFVQRGNPNKSFIFFPPHVQTKSFVPHCFPLSTTNTIWAGLFFEESEFFHKKKIATDKFLSTYASKKIIMNISLVSNNNPE